jgi:hypothetical protein
VPLTLSIFLKHAKTSVSGSWPEPSGWPFLNDLRCSSLSSFIVCVRERGIGQQMWVWPDPGGSPSSYFAVSVLANRNELTCKQGKWARGKKREGLLTQKGRVVLGLKLLDIFNEEDQEGGRKACA